MIKQYDGQRYLHVRKYWPSHLISQSGMVLCCIITIIIMQLPARAQSKQNIFSTTYISDQYSSRSFPICTKNRVPSILVSDQEEVAVTRAAKDLQSDIERITHIKPLLSTDKTSLAKDVIIVGTLGKSALLDQLIKNKKLKAANISGQWETFIIETVDKPFAGIDKALVIAGSDKRGTIYGLYDLSEKMGVSPWYYWADVPVTHKKNLFVKPGSYSMGSPAVKYRGLFINDEAPALSGWSKEKFGGFNHKFYEKVFELILRLKGNYLWPAMWGSAFNDDDSLNAKTASDYGIVMGTSHHEPMVRAHDEWRRYGKGKWNYDSNALRLQDFWRTGIQRMGSHENIVTIGMRGDGDEPMTQGTAIALLEKIVKDQRKIIAEVTAKDASATPQIWALYKEVQDYYDKGMRVPDDVTLLLCDDNWGNIRKLPKRNEKQHSGGYGIYYHYDYVGGPRNYKWINTNQLARIWEQMHLAYAYKADRIWIVNVGDIKPMEFPIQFFLDYAWDPSKISANQLDNYTIKFAAEQFGNKFAKEIAGIITQSTNYNSRRKPELLSPTTYSLTHYNEADRIVHDYANLYYKANNIYQRLPHHYKDAFYQLVLHPVEASYNLHKLYVTVAKNNLYAQQGRALTNALADSAKLFFEKDSLISYYYNHTLAGGKWNHMMDQTHIGYTYWQQPPFNKMPDVKNVVVPDAAAMGIALDGRDGWWPNEKSEASLSEFSVALPRKHYIDIFNRGKKPFAYSIHSSVPWLHFSNAKGTIETELRIWVSLHTQKVPPGKHRVAITINGADTQQTIYAYVTNIKPGFTKGFIELDKTVSIEAAHYTKAVGPTDVSWVRIPNFGKTSSGMTAWPVNAEGQQLARTTPHLEYEIFFTDTGLVQLQAYFAPTLNFHNSSGLKYAISIDDEVPQMINLHQGENNRLWEQWVANNINIKTSQHQLKKPGKHVVKYWLVDGGLVLEKLVLYKDSLPPAYLGPPETRILNFK